MNYFKEVTFGWIILIFLIPGLVLINYLYFSQAGTNPITLTPFLLISLLFVTVLLLFYRLSVIVATESILISFGIGLIWKTIDISRIQEVVVVKNPWFFGWGIRIIPKGTMYNISGTKGVELRFRDTNRIIRIGTKQPDKLKKEIEDRLKLLKPRG